MTGRARPAALLVLAAALGWAGCATGGAFREQVEAGRLEAAASTFEADSSLHRDEEALFRAGLLYADPGSPVHDPSAARRLLGRLLELHPDTGHRLAAGAVLGLLARRDSLARQLERLKAVDLDRPEPDTAGSR